MVVQVHGCARVAIAKLVMHLCLSSCPFQGRELAAVAQSYMPASMCHQMDGVIAGNEIWFFGGLGLGKVLLIMDGNIAVLSVMQSRHIVNNAMFQFMI